jgi:hypothetical protein
LVATPTRITACANSCGIYDSKGLTAVSMGRKERIREITLAKDKGDLKIDQLHRHALPGPPLTPFLGFVFVAAAF